jgi:hypothetical protein
MEGAPSAEPFVTLSSSALPFKRQKLHSTSAAKTITLTNTGNALLEIRGIATTTNEFVQSNNCGFSLPAATSCTIRVTFTPSKPGRGQGYLTIDAGNDGPHEVLLFGPGAGPAAAENVRRETGAPSIQ